MSNRPRSPLPENAPPEREYYVARHPGAQRTRRRRSSLLPVLLGLLLFGGGFLLGRAQAATAPEEAEAAKESEAVKAAVSDEARPVTVLPAAEDTSWSLLLVNGAHPLPEDFQVPELTELKGGHAIDSRAYPDLQRMMDDARAAGLEPLICSSYRTREKQAELFQNKTSSLAEQGYPQEDAEALAAAWVARPGTSEHETGLAVDIVDMDYQLLDRQQEQTPVQQWLMAHCADYGFILRYPADQSGLTGIGYEPWHYRYVGREAAEEIMDQGLCLEAYLGG